MAAVPVAVAQEPSWARVRPPGAPHRVTPPALALDREAGVEAMVKRDLEEADTVTLAVAKVVFAPRPRVPVQDRAQVAGALDRVARVAVIKVGAKVTSVERVREEEEEEELE